MALLLKCVTCGGMVSEKAEKCPSCGEPEFAYQISCPSCKGIGYFERECRESNVPKQAYDTKREYIPTRYATYKETKQCECSECGGKGKIIPWFKEPYRCNSCRGTGKVDYEVSRERKVDDSYTRVKYKLKCETCSGSGKVSAAYEKKN